MNIRFVSTLAPEDEDRVAPALVRIVSTLLDHLPIAYALSVETSADHVFSHACTADSSSSPSHPALSPESVHAVRSHRLS